MKWLKNLELLSKNGETGKCPFCNSDDTDYAVEVIDEKEMIGHGAIWCNECKKAFHISRMQVTEKLKKKSIPSGLNF